jgi:hypothetical protein
MLRTLRLGIATVLFCRAYGQVAPTPAFDVSEIRLNQSGEVGNDYFTIQPGGVFVAHNARINDSFSTRSKCVAMRSLVCRHGLMVIA